MLIKKIFAYELVYNNNGKLNWNDIPGGVFNFIYFTITWILPYNYSFQIDI